MRNLVSKLTSALLGALLLTTTIQPIGTVRAAGILYAAPGGLTTGSCDSWANACELRYALGSVAVSGDEIWVKEGTYTPTSGTDRNATFQLITGVSIYGGFAGTENDRTLRDLATNVTILSGNIGAVGSASDNSYHVVTGADGALLDGVTITGGHADSSSSPNDRGGGMYNASSSPALTNVIITGNAAYSFGGGMFNNNSSPVLTDVLIDNNSISYIGDGGGMYNTSGSAPDLTRVTISNNIATRYGGGMYNAYSSPILSEVTFSNNKADPYGSGGGMYNLGGSPVLIDVTFNKNKVRNLDGHANGGGMKNASSSPSLTNVTFDSNSCDLNGGGIHNTDSSPTLTNVTLYGNSAWTGGGIYNGTNSNPLLTNVTFSGNKAGYRGGGLINENSSSPTLTNVILWGNTAFTADPEIDNVDDSTTNISYSVVQDQFNSCPSGCICSNVIFTNPLLQPLADNGGFSKTMAISVGSSAIDTADPACPPPDSDQRGVSRPQGDHCDIGAFEFDDLTAPSLISFTRQNPPVSLTNADSLIFRAAFSESVKNVSSDDFTVSGTTAGVSGVSVVDSSTYDLTVSGGDLADFDGIVGLDLAGGQDITDLAGNALPSGEPATDETYELDNSAPTASITGAPNDPSSSASADFTFTTSGSPVSIECNLDSAGFAACDSSTTQQYAGPLSEGSHTFTVRVTDNVGNSSTDDYTWNIDLSSPTVTITSGPDSPTNSTSAGFTFTSTGSPSSFECDLDSAGFTACDSDTTHEYPPGTLVEGTHIFTVRVTDSAGNSGSDSFTWDVDTTDINVLPGGVVGYPGGKTIQEGGTVAGNFTTIKVTYDSDANNPAGNSDQYDVTNPYNYLLLQTGPDGVYDTDSCLAFLINGYNPLDDDIAIPTGPVTYDNHDGSGPFEASVTVNNGNPLPNGEYRLHICGSTSITDLYGNVLNNDTDVIRNFQVTRIPSNAAIPETGFAPNRVTARPPQTVPHGALGDLWLEIPSLGLREPIVGIPLENETWDVSWLDHEIGWLAGSAFPTWAGNSVLTGHVYDAFGRPGPFVGIDHLQYGTKIIVDAWGGQYVYEVRSVRQISPDNTGAMLEHKELPWLTLVTCRGYDEISGTYAYRVLVRAVLVDVQEE